MAQRPTLRYNPRHVLAVRLLLILTGVVLVLLASSKTRPGTQPSLALFSLGTATITTALFAVVTTAFGTDIPSLIEERILFQRETYDKGLERVYVSLGDDTIFHRFDQARSIDLMYNTGKNCCYRHGSRIAKAIRDNACRVRFLVADPDSTFFDNPDVVRGLCPGTDVRGELKDVVASLKTMVKALREQSPALRGGSLELRAYPCLPTSSLVIVDNEIARHTPYLPYSHSSSVPVYDVTRLRGGELFEQYRDAFERVWKASTPVLQARFGRPQREGGTELSREDGRRS